MKSLLWLFSVCALTSLAPALKAKAPIETTQDFMSEFLEAQDLYYQESGYLAESSETAANAIHVTQHGLETANWDLEFLRNAKQSIEISGSFCGGQLFRDILQIIEERLESCPQLKAHIITSNTLFEPSEQKKMDDLNKRFPDRFYCLLTSNVVVLFPDLTTIDNHVKVVVVDEKYYTVGGTNLDTTLATEGTYPISRNVKGGIVGAWLPAAVRDMDLVGFGTLAKTLRLEYYKLFALWEHYNVKGSLPKKDSDCKVQNRYFSIDETAERAVVERLDQDSDLIWNPEMKIVCCGPYERPNKISKEYEYLIDNAQEEIIIATMYFNPVKYVLKSLMCSVNNGIPLTIITNGITEVTPKYNDLFAWANRINYVPVFYGREFHFWEFNEAAKSQERNTTIYEYSVKDVLYHKKIMIIDRRIVLIGSYNLGTKSDKSDYEMVLVLNSSEIAQKILEVLEIDKSHSKMASSKQAREWYFNPIYAYLGGTQRSFHGFMSLPTEEELAKPTHEEIKKWLEGHDAPIFTR